MSKENDSDPVDDDWDAETDDPTMDDSVPAQCSAGESRRAALRRAIEIAKEERALRAALDDFLDDE